MGAIGRPQLGVLSFGTTHHAYLELDRVAGASSATLASAAQAVDAGVLTGAGCTVVIGFRPQLWAELAPQSCPPGLVGFDEPVVGPDGFTLPATQHDIVLWVAGGSRDVVFDSAREAVTQLTEVAGLADETQGWTYQHHRDLTGFVDGTENPPLVEAPSVALVPDGPGAGGSVLLLQRWPHDARAWEALSVHEQEQVIGRTKPDSIELDPKPASAHAARTDQDALGKILRRNMAYGSVRQHGTMFVGLSGTRTVLHEMLEHMVGADGGPRDALTLYSHAETGAYYFLPSVEDLTALGA